MQGPHCLSSFSTASTFTTKERSPPHSFSQAPTLTKRERSSAKS